MFKVNDHQYVEVSAGLKGDEDRLSFIGLETTDARAMAAYLRSKGPPAPAQVERDGDGNLSFMVNDPDNHPVQFVQHMPGSAHFKFLGQHLPETRTSERIIHVGVHVTDRKTTDRFGDASRGERLDRVLANPGPPTVRSLGSMHHMALDVLRFSSPTRPSRSADTNRTRSRAGWPVAAEDVDPDGTRTEFIVRKRVKTPCCSPLHDPTLTEK